MSKNKRKNREVRTAILFLLPSILGVSIFVLLPFLDVIRRSFMETIDSGFAGLDNYKELLANKAFKQAMENTGHFLIICIPLLLVISLLTAFLLHSMDKRLEFTKAAFLVPMAVPVASMVLLWQLLFHYSGLLNRILVLAGKEQIDFINTKYAFWILVFSYLWKNIGYDMVLWLAGLDGISKSLYEAASVDGAGTWIKFRYITLPELKPTLYTVGILSLINSFKVFREAYLISGDYPQTNIYMLQHLFNNWFVNLDIQEMTSGAVILVLIILIFLVLLNKCMGES